MRIETHTIEQLIPAYPIDKMVDLEQTILFDIETTGFSAASTYLYMIGCGYFSHNQFHIIQWLCEHKEEESEILRQFFEFAKDFHFLLQYNGVQFDIPYLTKKAEKYHIPPIWDQFTIVDLYKLIKPYRFLFFLPSLKQKSIETFLKIKRNDQCDGGELIPVYLEYEKTHKEHLAKLLFLHNYEDILGMIKILPILYYRDLFCYPVKVTGLNENVYEDYDHSSKKEVIIDAQLSFSLPYPVCCKRDQLFLYASNTLCRLRFPIVSGELKMFYDHYKDYFYLPEEDTAIHKSVGVYVDRNHRQNATRATCYTKVSGTFLPQRCTGFSPCFKENWNSVFSYIQYNDQFKNDRSLQNEFVNEVLLHFSLKK
ncbi:MAG: ribonuclease H-like domain-containing protein [Clostridia bacterium]|nr:ribonuclease H-like domain-containing protein [Clostridia bacterium]